MSKAQNPFTFAERLKNHGYAQFFGFKDPISSYGSWTEKQIISLQMLIVDPAASAKIGDYSVECPVVYPPSKENVKIFDCFWYIDHENNLATPMMYQITDITESTGFASCRLIVLELPSEYEKHHSVGVPGPDAPEWNESEERNEDGGEDSDSVSPSPPAPGAKRSRLYNLGETIRLPLTTIVTCPKLNQHAFQMLGRNGIKIKSEVSFEADFGAFLEGDKRPKSASFDRDNEDEEGGSVEDEDEDDVRDDMSDEGNYVTETSHVWRGAETSLGSSLDDSMDSMSEETSKLFVSKNLGVREMDKGSKVARRKPLGYIDPSVKKREKKSSAAKKGKKRPEPYKQIKRENNIAETTITKRPETPKKSQIGNPSRLTPEDKENVETPVASKPGPHMYQTTHRSDDVSDSSPATVCITFVQSRHTKIQYHTGAVGRDSSSSCDSDDEFGDFKSASFGETVKTIKVKGVKDVDAKAVRMKVQRGFKIIE